MNGGTAKDFNQCFGPQFGWAAATAGTTPQGTASLYINTANPGSQSSWWPKSDSDQPVADATAPGPRGVLPAVPVRYPNGSAVGCSGTVDPYGPACSYVYGYVRAEQAVLYAQEQLGGAFSPTLRWWLDVETSNTWVGPAVSKGHANWSFPGRRISFRIASWLMRFKSSRCSTALSAGPTVFRD